LGEGHALPSSLIPFITPKQGDSNKALPDSSRDLLVPGDISAFVFLLTSIAMQTLRDRYHSIPLDQRIPMHRYPKLWDQWQNGYPYFCTLVLQVSAFKLLATECYRHADTLGPIPFNSPRRADSNETFPDSGGHLPTEVSPFFTLLTSITMRTIQNLYYSIPLGEQTPMRPFLTPAHICLLRYLPFPSC